MGTLGAYVADAAAALALPTGTRVIGIEVLQTCPDRIDVHVWFSTGAVSWATFRTDQSLTPELGSELEAQLRLQFDAELARRRMLQ